MRVNELRTRRRWISAVSSTVVGIVAALVVVYALRGRGTPHAEPRASRADDASAPRVAASRLPTDGPSRSLASKSAGAPPRLSAGWRPVSRQVEATTDSDNLDYVDPGLSDAMLDAMDKVDAETGQRMDVCIADYVKELGGREAAIAKLGTGFHPRYHTVFEVKDGVARVVEYEPIDWEHESFIRCLREAEIWTHAPFPAPKAKHASLRLQRTASIYFRPRAADAGG